MTKTRTERGAVSLGVGVVLSIIALLVLIAGIYAIKYVTADARGAVDQREKTLANGSYRIARYDYFFDLCGSVQAKEDQIKNTEAREADNSGTAGGFTESQKSAIMLALQNSRASLIREYNASSAKADTAAHFKSSNLPYTIDINQENTTCAA